MQEAKSMSKKKATQIYNMLEEMFMGSETVEELEEFQEELKSACAKGFPIDHIPYGEKDTLFNIVADNTLFPEVFLPSEIYEQHIQAILGVLLELGAEINHRNEDGLTSLLFCGKYPYLYDRFMYLLEHGADPNICDNNNNDALRYFLELKVYEKDASKCSLKDLQAVVDRMTDIDRIGEGGITAIGVACDAYKLEIPSKRKAILPVLKILLNAGANPYIDNYWQYNTERLYNNMSQKDYENGITELETFFRMYTEQKQNLYQRTVAEYEYAL